MDFLSLKLLPEEYEKILYILTSLRKRTQATSVFLISRSGQEIACDGESNGIDRQALASLAASNLAATFGLAQLIGESEFERIYHKGDTASILINPTGEFGLLLFILGDQKIGSNFDIKSLTQASMILADVLQRSKERSSANSGG